MLNRITSYTDTEGVPTITLGVQYRLSPRVYRLAGPIKDSEDSDT